MSDFTLKRGLSNVFAAEILSDENSEEGYKVGTPLHLIPAGEMSRTASSESTPVFFDNVVFYQSGSESATEISITGAALRPADIARLNAKHVDTETGAVLDTGEYKEKYFALGGETKNTDGTKELFWFMKGTFAIPEQTDKTEDDSTDTNGMTLNFSAIQTKHQFDVGGEKKPMKRVVIDTKTTKLKEDQDWTAQVVTPDNLATIVEKIATT
jgi:phi13 family phage major tail protein